MAQLQVVKVQVLAQVLVEVVVHMVGTMQVLVMMPGCVVRDSIGVRLLVSVYTMNNRVNNKN